MNRDRATARLMTILARHVGREKAIDAGVLHEQVFGQEVRHKINDTRALRQLITELRRQGVPIGSISSKDGGGYYLMAAGSEMEDYCARIRRRALRALAMEAKLRNLGLPDLVGQIHLNLRPPGPQTEIAPAGDRT